MTEVPDSVEDWLDELTPAQLDDVARLLQRRAEDERRVEWQTDDTGTTEANRDPPTDVHGDPFPEGVPAKATLTQKTINGNDYWYWQWRADDGTVTSKYKSPVDRS